MHATRMFLPAAMGMALLAGNVSTATAHLVGGDEGNWSPKVHSAYSNLRYCDHRSRVEDYLPGGQYSGTEGNQSADSNVAFEQVSLLTGAGFFTEKFTIDSAGTYQATLTDFEFPNPLTETGLNITSATESFGTLIGPGSFTFDADPGSYYLSFFGKAPELGQYGIEVAQYGILISQPGNLSAVPVPGTVWLFSSGLIGLARVIRRKAV